VPDEDGFVRMSPRHRRNDQPQSQQEHAPPLHKRQISQYDNVVNPSPLSNTTTTTSKSGISSVSSSQQRSSSLKNTHQQRTPILPSVFTTDEVVYLK
jgi:hypothetical protein